MRKDRDQGFKIHDKVSDISDINFSELSRYDRNFCLLSKDLLFLNGKVNESTSHKLDDAFTANQIIKLIVLDEISEKEWAQIAELLDKGFEIVNIPRAVSKNRILFLEAALEKAYRAPAWSVIISGERRMINTGKRLNVATRYINGRKRAQILNPATV